MFGIAEQLEQNTFDIGNGNALTAQLRQPLAQLAVVREVVHSKGRDTA